MSPRIFFACAAVAAVAATASAQSPLSFELNTDTYNSYTAMSVTQGDFNRDGKPDLVVGGGAKGTDITLRLGNGDGTFQAPMLVGVADTSEVLEVLAGDVNGDGKLDVVALCIGGTFDVFLGNGDGTFRTPVAVATVNSPRTATMGDFFGNGLLDVAVGDANGDIEVFKNVGGENFALTSTIPVGNGSAIMKTRAGDMNADGHADLGVLTHYGAYVLWGDGSGGFAPVLMKSYTSNAPAALNVGDVNQDGISDVMVSYNCSASVQSQFAPACAGWDVFYGQANKQVRYGHAVTQAGVVAIRQPWGVDVNGDGVADLVGETTSAGGDLTGLVVWLGHADGTFEQTGQSFVASSGSGGGLVAGDWNRDGRMDFAQTLPGQAQTEIYLNASARAACATSAVSQSVTVCAPVDGTYSPSPVTVQANAFDTTTVTAIQEYVDHALVTSKSGSSLNLSLTEALGPHYLVTKAWDAKGMSFRSDRRITVYSGTPGETCAAAVGTANLCLPAGASSGPQVRILANGATMYVPTAAQLYVDGKMVIDQQNCTPYGACLGGTTAIDTTETLTAGSHTLVFKLWDAHGDVSMAEKSVMVN